MLKRGTLLIHTFLGPWDEHGGWPLCHDPWPIQSARDNTPFINYLMGGPSTNRLMGALEDDKKCGGGVGGRESAPHQSAGLLGKGGRACAPPEKKRSEN